MENQTLTDLQLMASKIYEASQLLQNASRIWVNNEDIDEIVTKLEIYPFKESFDDLAVLMDVFSNTLMEISQKESKLELRIVALALKHFDQKLTRKDAIRIIGMPKEINDDTDLSTVSDDCIIGLITDFRFFSDKL